MSTLNSDACIYTVANKSSQQEFANLLYSIRASGCDLDIVLIPFGGPPITDPYLLSQVRLLPVDTFPRSGLVFIAELGKVLNCPSGFLRRFLAFFGPYAKFIYTDNDIVALSNWNHFIDHLDSFDLVHADKEYTTYGRYNFSNPAALESNFGVHAHEAAITAGHFAARKSDLMIDSLRQGLGWMSANTDSCFLHDQTLLQLASLCGGLNCLNLCKPPYHWLSSWAGDYANSLDIIHKVQQGYSISHLHYSGSPIGLFEQPVDELLLSGLRSRQRLRINVISGLKSLTGINEINRIIQKAKRRLKP